MIIVVMNDGSTRYGKFWKDMTDEQREASVCDPELFEDYNVFIFTDNQNGWMEYLMPSEFRRIIIDNVPQV